MSKRDAWFLFLSALLVLSAPLTVAGEQQTTADRTTHQESAGQHQSHPPADPEYDPSLPEGMTLDEALERAAQPPPEGFPEPIEDDRIYVFTIFEQFEYRVASDDDMPDHLGWEAQGWIGRDFEKFWWKSEGEAVLEGSDEGETETDLLYSRLITPFWSAQIGVQYAYGWGPGDDEDRWSGVIAVQGLAPFKFEIDNSLYLSEDGDVTLAFEAEYDLRITQRLVLQPRTEVLVSFQDIPERELGSGVTGADLDLRLRYEWKREFAPYAGLRYTTLIGETEEMAEAAGEDSDHVLFIGGIRFAF